MEFSEFGLSESQLKAIKELGYTKATDIQEVAIPHLLEKDDDFVGQAQTGTGKTAAFVLPLLEKISPSSKQINAIILTPTRELANQIQNEIEKLGKYSGIKSLAIYGGASYDKQITGIKKGRPQIIVGTPGRVMDLIDRKVLKFEEAKFVVLDEADEMLNMGFLDDVKSIISNFHDDKKMWMFSATMPRPILDMIKNDFKNPLVVSVKKNTVSNEDIEQKYYVVKRRYHKEAVCRLLDAVTDVYGIIFCKTRIETTDLGNHLVAKGYSAMVLNGDMGQAQRDAAMEKFKSKKVRLLVCTDIAARGIDVNNLTHVFNYGLPQDLESYIHRIGRTGRAGMKGMALTLVDPMDSFKIRRIESFNKVKMTPAKLPSVTEIKKSLVQNELETMSGLKESVLGKNGEFKIDDTFSSFSEFFEDADKDEILKIMFSWKFNREFRRYDDLGSLDESSNKKSSPGKSFEPSNQRRGRNDFKKGGATSGNVTRFFVNLGKKDGVNLDILLTDISKQVGLQKRQIQNVDLKHAYSFIDVPAQFNDKFIKGQVTLNNKVARFEFSN